MLHMQSVYMQVVIIQLVFSDHTYHTALRKAYNLEFLQANQICRSHPHTLPRVQLRPHIQIEVQAFANLALVSSRVKVNHIFYSGPTPINNPIMPIKRRRITQNTIKSRLRCQCRRLSTKGDQLRPTALLTASSFLPV